MHFILQLTFTLNTVVWSAAEMEMNIVSAERVSEYTELPSEVEMPTLIPKKNIYSFLTKCKMPSLVLIK